MELPLAMTFIVSELWSKFRCKKDEITHIWHMSTLNGKQSSRSNVGETTINIWQDLKHSNGELHAQSAQPIHMTASAWEVDTKFFRTMTARRRCASMCSQVFLVNFSQTYFIAISIDIKLTIKISAIEWKCAMHRCSGCFACDIENNSSSATIFSENIYIHENIRSKW